MKLTTEEIPVVEMTKAEYKELYENFYTNGYRWTIGGITITAWWNEDGHNMVGIEGEDRLRDVRIANE